jgi:hypothetical protein
MPSPTPPFRERCREGHVEWVEVRVAAPSPLSGVGAPPYAGGRSVSWPVAQQVLMARYPLLRDLVGTSVDLI